MAFLTAAVAALLFSSVVVQAASASQQKLEVDAPVRAKAYYHFSLGYLYEQLALEHMNR